MKLKFLGTWTERPGAKGVVGVGGGASLAAFSEALKMSIIDDLRASLPEMMLVRALAILVRAVPMPPSSGLQEARMALDAVSNSFLAVSRNVSCPWSLSKILLASSLGNLKKPELPGYRERVAACRWRRGGGGSRAVQSDYRSRYLSGFDGRLREKRWRSSAGHSSGLALSAL